MKLWKRNGGLSNALNNKTKVLVFEFVNTYTQHIIKNIVIVTLS